jgi:site-specific DNA-methyltransferase (adenine-specific)
VVLDPFCGTGTTMLVAFQFGRKSIGIDLAEDYIEAARERCHYLL